MVAPQGALMLTEEPMGKNLPAASLRPAFSRQLSVAIRVTLGAMWIQA
jgi:hypothetical protein